MTEKRRVTPADLFHSPASVLAFGFGTGLVPVAPGTFGTLPGLLIVAVLAKVPLIAYLPVVLTAFVAGVFICDLASKQLGSHDHGAIVWDEIVGMMITMIAVPLSLGTLLLGFLLFRLFDVVKPWPIRWLDRHVDGGFGIMIDDVLAGIFACVVLHGVLFSYPDIAGWIPLSY